MAIVSLFANRRWLSVLLFVLIASPLSAQQAPATLGEEPVDLSPLLTGPVEDDEYQQIDAPQESLDDQYDANDYATPDYDEPAPTVEAAEPADEPAQLDAATRGETESEIIRERFANRQVKIERHVAQDDYGNYINHGSWKQWDEQGNLVAQGEYNMGERNGVWHRWHRRDESPLFTQVPFNQFEGPFISQAKFDNGQLDGQWIIFDAKQNKVSDWAFSAGQRHGTSTWWYSNGRKMREINYLNGEVDGFAREWSPEGKPTADDKYVKGHKIATKTSYHSAAQKKAEGTYLFAKVVRQTDDNWWEAKPATFTREGQDVKHGVWTSWYPNGQEHIRGEYRDDLEVGKFTWWYSNGQKALEGSYVDGKPEGRWTWWHENGQKATEGSYENGTLAGRWMGWTEDGKLVRQEEHGAGGVTASKPVEQSAARPADLPR
ncbi:MAG: hypothetical protein KDA42_02490 [Planctomycetales bacterium]|nr:hypothetical protein [Planctomycetales bacterium]